MLVLLGTTVRTRWHMNAEVFVNRVDLKRSSSRPPSLAAYHIDLHRETNINSTKI
jgi:hypothetical protein